MEKVDTITTQDISFRPKFQFNDKLPYIQKKDVPIWVNNYKINFTKDLYFNEFSVEFIPPIGNENTLLKEKLFRKLKLSDMGDYKLSLFTGDAFFLKVEKDSKINDIYSYPAEFKQNKYEVVIRNTKKRFNLSREYGTHPVHKMLFELVVNKVIKSNPAIEFYKKIFVKTNEKKTIKSERSRINLEFFPGYTTSINIMKEGIFLNVALKNRYLNTKTCLELIKECRCDEEIVDKFVGRSVKTGYSKKNYIVDGVAKDKTPNNTIITYDGNEVTLVKYYKKAHNVDIKDTKQILFEVKMRDGATIHLVPELCFMTGIDDSMVKDREFMQNLAMYTKFEPQERVNITAKFFELMYNKDCRQLKDKQGQVLTKEPSSNDVRTQLGVEMASKTSIVNGCVMQAPLLKTGNKALYIDKVDRNPVHNNALLKNMDKKLLVVYHSKNYSSGASLEEFLNKAGKDYKLSIPQVEWAEVSSFSPKDWIETVNYFQPKNFSLVVFLIDNRSESLYNHLKRHSLSDLGYISQVVKAESINGKRGMSVASKLLCQMNNKLGGSSYVLDVDNKTNMYRGSNLMLIGVDSSHISGKRTGVAMVATTNKDYSSVTNQEDIIEEKNKTQLVYCVGRFINKAMQEYFKNTKELPKGIVIYRQGVSEEQKEYLKQEVATIECYCKGLHKDSVNKSFEINYVYVLVNKKNNYKFFHSHHNRYENPEAGIVLFEGATNGDKNEFFIQPQKVTQGTATPTHYHIAFGNLQIDPVIPKLTYDLCSIYPNWPGPVRVPHVLKLAEKLAKMISKSTRKELHENVKNTACYL